MGILEITLCRPINCQSLELGSVARDGDPRLESEQENGGGILWALYKLSLPTQYLVLPVTLPSLQSEVTAWHN